MTDPRQLLMDADKPRFDPWLLRLWRERAGLTQSELADAMHGTPYAKQEVSRIERYAVAPRKGTVARLAAALKVAELDLCSTAHVWSANRAEYDAWCADGRPPLASWLRELSGGSDV